MEQLLTANVASNLYWLGRYLERMESTLMEIIPAFDNIIDVDKASGKKLYKRFEIDIKYKNANSFLDAAVFGEHDANIYTLISYVRENAIISRSYIDANAFGSIIELSDTLKQANNDNFVIDCSFVEKISSRVSEVWGELTRKQKEIQAIILLDLENLLKKLIFI